MSAADDSLVGLVPIGADPKWVKWVASLRHEPPTTIREAVEQLMFDAITIGGDMGPNGNVWYGWDEGMVRTNDFIESWVKRFSDIAKPSQETCHITVEDNMAETEGMGDVWIECDKCHWQMTLESTTPRFNYCPNCGRRVDR